jgi:hypothetical protein
MRALGLFGALHDGTTRFGARRPLCAGQREPARFQPRIPKRIPITFLFE